MLYFMCLYIIHIYIWSYIFSIVMFQHLSQTALHWAAKHGKEDMTTMLAEAGADINTKAVRAS